MKESYNHEYLILPEGEADRKFLAALIAQRGLAQYRVIRDAQGDGKFGERLKEIKINRGMQTAKLLVLVTDSDGGAKEKFRSIVRQVKKAGDYLPPSRLRKRGRKPANLPKIAVVTLPWTNRTGCLETLLLDPLSDAHPRHRARAVRFIKASPTGRLQVSKRSKAELCSMVAAVHTDDPSCAVSQMWKDAKHGFGYLLPSRHFDRLEKLLRDLAA